MILNKHEHEKLVLLCKYYCKKIGCSGISDDLCFNTPYQCQIVQKAMPYLTFRNIEVTDDL